MIILDYQIDLQILTLLVLCIASQTVFGVGVLLWGTPSLLILGYSYVEALSLLLPISVLVSLLQIRRGLSVINLQDIKLFILYCAPVLFISLTFMLFYELDPTNLVIFVLLLGMVLRIQTFHHIETILARYKNILLPLIGFVHGASNLGGSVLVIWATYSAQGKLHIRSMVAATYIFLALAQYITIWFIVGQISIPIYYIFVTLITYPLATSLIFNAVSDKKFHHLVTMLMFLMACALLIKKFS